MENVTKRPNIIVILNDDMGYSDIGCYGGEVDTPNLDRLAANGVRLTQFYNTARCSPSRASLLTGLHPHQTGIGVLVEDQRPEGYAGNLNKNCVTLAEALGADGYRTYMSGKWHVATDKFNVSDTWPKQRGFDRYYGIICGAANYYHPRTLTRDNENIDDEAQQDDAYYFTDAISDNAARFVREHRRDFGERPFFLYAAYTAPHWPLHAKPEDVGKYKGRFDAGWDLLREERLERMARMGIIDERWKLSERDPDVPAWEDEEHKAWRLRCMEVYAAQIDCMDQGIGRIVQALEETGELDNTLILFLADNGGCAERLAPSPGEALLQGGSARARTKSGEPVRFGNDPALMPGEETTYQSYGIAWANLSNTPFRLYKHWVHEGGIATPFIAHWPARMTEAGAVRHSPAQLTDVMATVLEATGAPYPSVYDGHVIPPCEGQSLLSLFEADRERNVPLYWEHEGNAAVRLGKWKLVRKYPGAWELYDMDEDRTELNDLAGAFPERVREMAALYAAWAGRCGVVPRETIAAWEEKRREPQTGSRTRGGERNDSR
ncbi:arylsulfatase [Cohnella zeiphila]|uniref:Arylsulfatase n=1 Tax=Cohnella zeiphila TaxID=2761120 RepID=A0A7X0SLE8_9BACL|nr:arylsulfatase [Cohnella zeiphila]MBB6730860.1 arylsulfatase [Cohnella zeiphila]